MENFDMELIYKLISIVITIIIAIVTRYVIPAIKSKIDMDKFELIITYIGKCVMYAEKFIEGTGCGDVKAQEVLKMAKDFADKHGFEISEHQLRAIIEGVFTELDAANLVNQKDA